MMRDNFHEPICDSASVLWVTAFRCGHAETGTVFPVGPENSGSHYDLLIVKEFQQDFWCVVSAIILKIVFVYINSCKHWYAKCLVN